MSTTSPGNLVHGRLTLLATGAYREFTYNPSQIKDGHGYDFPSMKIPGISNPLLQGGAGTDRDFSFSLDLDGERGYKRRRSADGSTGPSFDISDELNWYLHLTYPEGAATLGEPDSHPPIVLFTFGPFYRAVPCVVPKVDFTLKQFLPDLTPVKAEVSISLKQKITGSVARSSIYNPGTARNY